MKKISEALRNQMPPAPRPGAAKPAAEPVCPICHGDGFLLEDLPVGHPRFGRLHACECLTAQENQRALEDLQRFSNLEPFRDKTFANFDVKVPGVEKAYTVARKFAEDPKGWLVLRGGCGCGKTHLAAAIANEALGRHVALIFAVVPDLLDHLRSAFGPSSEIAYDELFDKVRGTNLLVLDDLGTESSTPWAREKLYQILNHRYNCRLPTVITTNRDLRQIDERIVSRMSDCALCTMIEIKADDYRRRGLGERRKRSGGLTVQRGIASPS